MLDVLADIDWSLIHAVEDVRWSVATVLFVVLSAWWVQAPLFVLLAGLADLAARRLPLTAMAGGLAATLASSANSALKEAFDRERPPVADPSFDALVAIPASDSFPSGHAATAFAAATAISALEPRLARPLLVLAALVAFSRVYLGVHFPFDVLAGAAFGASIGIASAWIVRAAGRRREKRDLDDERAREPGAVVPEREAGHGVEPEVGADEDARERGDSRVPP